MLVNDLISPETEKERMKGPLFCCL